MQTGQVLNEGTPLIFCPSDEVKLLPRMQVAAVRWSAAQAQGMTAWSAAEPLANG
ncbi:MAG: hypothetical protein ACK514_04720 [Bacteroidota bacterium]|nr:hypothetical protein [Cytophagales bacterium]MCA6427873.1 hypothetical protein [Cytophagales bacterium]